MCVGGVGIAWECGLYSEHGRVWDLVCMGVSVV
jgi:hypothetical protein